MSKRGEQPTVPKADFRSYYGMPVLNQPTWKAPDIPGYFFLGGLAGASSVLAAGAEITGRRTLATAGKLGALGAITASAGALIHDLGRPERFLNMLRVFKPSSPLSMGSWLLAAYGPAAGVAAATAVTGLFPVSGRVATMWAAALGPAVTTYTAALVSDTAVPAWHEAYPEMPFIFAGSAASAAGGLGLIAASLAQNAPAQGFGLFGAALELSAATRMERRLGILAEPYRQKSAGVLMKVAKGLTAAGALGATLVAGRSRAAAAVSGAALLAGSACMRFGIFEGGIASSKDPKYTVTPQRERLASMDHGQAPGSHSQPAGN